MMIKFIIPGRPVPAVRMTQAGKYKKPSAQRYLTYKEHVGWAAKAAGIKKFRNDVAIDITLYLRCGPREGDWDNYAKAICDGLNGIGYVDDRQIVDGRCRKVFGVKPNEERVEVEIREVVE
jgi:crossover junction endodeoxyribonuclease RusA